MLRFLSRIAQNIDINIAISLSLLTFACDTRIAACNTCKVEVNARGMPCHASTTNVISHLKNRHPEVPKQWQDANAANGTNGRKKAAATVRKFEFK